MGDIQSNGWAQRTCINCGAVYQYRLGKNLFLPDELKLIPCPHCGALPLDMIGAWRAYVHGRMILFSLGIGVVGAYLGRMKEYPLQEATLLIIGGALLVTLGHIAALVSYTNTDLAENLAQARKLLSKGSLVLGRPGTRATPDGVLEAGGSSSGRRTAVGLVLLAVLGGAAPEALRLVRGWPHNPGAQPPVLGPGDTSRLYLSQTIRTFSGIWQGQVFATLLNAAELGAPERFDADTSHIGFGGSMQASSSPQNTPTTLWADITVPALETLAGKSAHLQLDLQVRYPMVAGPRSYQDTSEQLSEVFPVQLASPGAGKTYLAFWWSGLLGGCLAALLGGILLRRAASNLAQPPHR